MSLFLAGAIFGEVGVSLFVDRAIFETLGTDGRRNFAFDNTKCALLLCQRKLFERTGCGCQFHGQIPSFKEVSQKWRELARFKTLDLYCWFCMVSAMNFLLFSDFVYTHGCMFYVKNIW